MNSAEREAKREEIKKHTREFLLREGTVNVIHAGGRRLRIAEPEQSILVRAARLKEKGKDKSGDKGQGTDADKGHD